MQLGEKRQLQKRLSSPYSPTSLGIPISLKTPYEIYALPLPLDFELFSSPLQTELDVGDARYFCVAAYRR
jgi:hypothetical protein